MLLTEQENAQLWNLSCEMDEAINIFRKYGKVYSFTDEQALALNTAFKAVKQAIDAIDDCMLKCCEHSLP